MVPSSILSSIVLGNKEFIFLVNFHHIISDATSVAIFFDELRLVYACIADNKPVDLPSLPLNYTDYVQWEQRWTGSEAYKRQVEYWKTELSGAQEVLQLPVDFHRPKMQTYKGSEYHFEVNSFLREKLVLLGKRHGTGLFVPLLAAFGVLLSRYTAQNDLTIGVPVANRMQEELEPLIGVLINSLPLRLIFPENVTFSEAVEITKKKFLSGYENQEVAFERLVEELKVKRNTGSTPIFQVIFNFLTGVQKEFDLQGIRFRLEKGERRSAQVDLTLSVNDHKSELGCSLEFNTDLFKRKTVGLMAGHYLSILEEVVKDENLEIDRIRLLSGEESDLILNKWNENGRDYPKDRCTHHLFESQVLRTPNEIALRDDHHELTYKELNERANQLASYLVKQGAREDTFVAVYLDRNADLIITLLAVAKTGSTYLPLDPIFPKGRLGMILEDAVPVMIITQSSLADDLPETAIPVIRVDDLPDVKNEPRKNLSFGNPEKGAFILYTSGSTGKPKGVIVKHNSTVNAVRAITRLMDVSGSDILLSATTYTFDVAEMEMYLPLFNGGKLVIASQETVVNIELLKNKIRESGATLFLATPVTFKMLIISSWEGKPDLKVLSGGEGLPKEIASRMLSLCKGVWNGYAPTETTIYSLIKPVTAADVEGDGYVSLGRPIDNTVLYVLNPKRIPVPAGIPGELYIGGDGVSLGYQGLPEMTSERFITDPLGLNPGMKFYKTGDLVQYTEEGNVTFLNRIDFQVKIRGFRIELGEIESVLSLYEPIREKVVVVKEDPSHEKMLVAYLVTENNVEINYQDLRQFLKGRLPDYMIPSAFVRMEKFPLTATLKIDRKALPEPESLAGSLSRKYKEPVTPTEKELAKIWSSLLNIKKIGVDDDFFDIGGHSMIAVALVVKIEKEMGIRIPLATLFERSTISLMAELIDNGPESVKWRSLVPIRPEGRKKPLFLVHGMGLNVLLYTTVVNYLDPDQPVYGLQAKGLNGIDEPLDSIEGIAAYYISEIMTVDPEGPYAMAGFSLGGRIAYEMARQIVAMGKSVSFLGLFDASADDSFGNLPFLERNSRRIGHLVNYVTWNISHFFREKSESKFDILKRRWKGLEKKFVGLDFKVSNMEMVSKGKRKELPKYLRKVHKANSRADRKYVIQPYPGPVHLFKAQKQTFYITDPVSYGWDKMAKGGVFIHTIPGEHSNTFAPPNDKYFANVLQEHLNQSI